MATVHDLFEMPADKHSKLWRFMTLPKFLSLMDSSSLYFTRADRLGDPFEGTITQQTVMLRNLLYPSVAPAMTGLAQAIRKTMFVSCWQESEYETAGMWRQYCDEREGIAIQTTFDLLWNSLPDPGIHIGRVSYINYETDIIPDGNAFYPILHKRLAYADEHEIRAIVSEHEINFGTEECLTAPKHHDGLLKKIDLNLLVQKVYVAPSASSWFVEVVQNACKLRGLQAIVVKSNLLAASPLL